MARRLGSDPRCSAVACSWLLLVASVPGAAAQAAPDAELALALAAGPVEVARRASREAPFEVPRRG